MKCRKGGILLYLSLILYGEAFSHEEMEYIIEAVRINESEAPRIDGKFDDAVWKKGKVITNLVQRTPTYNAPATERSEIYILYDKENLYVGCRLYDSHPENIIRELRRREDILSSDRMEIYFDTFHNHRTGYKFAMNPYGVKVDEQRYDDNRRNIDWDAIWESGADVDSLGWVAEFKIPFFNMRFPDTEGQIWGFFLQREMRYKAETAIWKPVSYDDRTSYVRMSKMGHLTGIKGIRPGRNFEFYPYIMSGFSETHSTPKLGENEGGFDLKYGVTSDITLDMTVNPDFAQVEADVLQINLTRFPTRFPEKRQFFLEGRGIFQTPAELFFSRRIGAKGDILWGTKITGRTEKNGLEYGFLASQTGDWNYFGLSEKDIAKEKALYGIARIRKGFSNGSSVGMIATNKEGENGDYSRIFGVDGNILFKEIYKSYFQIATSLNDGLLKDNDYYSFGLFRLDIPWTFRFATERIEPDYDINSTGFMNKELYRGKQNFRTGVSYNPFVEKYGIRQFNISSSWMIGEDIFTNKYINNWVENYPDVSVDSRYITGNLRPNYYAFEQSSGIRATNEMNIGFQYYIAKTNELTETYYLKRKGFNISTPKTGNIQKMNANLNFNWGTFYNFAQKYVGSDLNINLQGTSWVRSNLGLELDGRFTKTYDPSCIMDGKHFRISMRNTYLFTKDFFVRLYTQGRWGTTYYDKKSRSNTYLVSFLLGWECHPGSWCYLAYNEGREDLNDYNDPYFEERNFLMTDRTLVAKIQYVLHKWKMMSI